MNFIEFLTKWILNFEPIFYTTEQVIMLIIDLIKVPLLSAFISAAYAECLHIQIHFWFSDFYS